MPINQVLLAFLVGFVVTILAVLHWNRGDPMFVNLEAQDEPIVAGAGALVIAMAWGDPLWMTAGFVLFSVATVSRYSDRWDISEVI